MPKLEDSKKSLKDVALGGARKALKAVVGVASEVQEKIENIDPDTIKEQMLDVADRGVQALKQHAENRENTKEAMRAALAEKAETENRFTVDDSLKLLYFLMNSDNKTTTEEKNRFYEIVTEFDPEKTIDKGALIAECEVILSEGNNEDNFDFIMDKVSAIIARSKEDNSGVISSKHLLWNMLVLAYSDENYSEEEKKIVRTACCQMEIDKNILQEMELAITTILAITADKERAAAEIDERVEVILDSIYQLIGD